MSEDTRKKVLLTMEEVVWSETATPGKTGFGLAIAQEVHISPPLGVATCS